MKSFRFACAVVTTLALYGIGVDSISTAGSGSSVVECPAIGCSSDNPNDPLCGTNGVTYPNECEFSLAAMCSGPQKITIAHKGACNATATAAPNGTNEEEMPTLPKVPAPTPALSPAKSGATPVFAVATLALVVVAVAALL